MSCIDRVIVHLMVAICKDSLPYSRRPELRLQELDLSHPYSVFTSASTANLQSPKGHPFCYPHADTKGLRVQRIEIEVAMEVAVAHMTKYRSLRERAI